MEQEKQLHWFPGHMAKAKKAIKEKLSVIDVVVEVVDARAPLSSRSKDLQDLIKHKKSIVILNKADLADKKITELWCKYFIENNTNFLVTQSLLQKIKPRLIQEINLVYADKLKQQTAKGIKNPQIRVLILGLPNVGKSTLINNLVQRKVVKTANRPGVTKGQQWIKLDDRINLLDSPGILSTKIDDEDTKYILSLIKALPFDSFFLQEISLFALKFLMLNYSQSLLNYYQISFDVDNLSQETLQNYFQELAKKYNFKLNSQEYNIDRAMNLLIQDLQSAKLGFFSFEKPL